MWERDRNELTTLSRDRRDRADRDVLDWRRGGAGEACDYECWNENPENAHFPSLRWPVFDAGKSFDPADRLPVTPRIARRDAQSRHDTIAMCAHLVLHLHRLDDADH